MAASLCKIDIIYPFPLRFDCGSDFQGLPSLLALLQVQPLGSPFADHSCMEDSRILSRGSLLARDSSTSGPSNLLSSSSSRQMVCMADEDFQAGLKSMPERIPPLPNAISQVRNNAVQPAPAAQYYTHKGVL